ncbi:MAG TPA: enoyl-CoA hydratase-related protein [Acidimicrobiia bacterium]|jgi:enoyl-CoA hydratase/carnithine racemase|nr:enoyl-CoA hydratase-related protein [Acidimicrobiia bacterium]
MPVTYEVAGHSATITIDDPERSNPMSIETMAGLLEHTRSAVDDPGVRVIVYTGAGDRAFCAGGDLSGSFVDDPVAQHRARGDLADLFRLMTRGGKPTLARVNGHAIAGGFGLAVACDITICVDDAKLGTSEVKVGLWPMMISAVLARSMPRKAVLEMMLTGRLITPEEALRWGAVSRVVARDELDDAVSETVAALGALSQAALMLGKDSFYGVTDLDFDTSLDRLQGGLTEIALTDDAGEGVRAFVEKRPPEWSGR